MIELNDEFWKDLDKAITNESELFDENLGEIDQTFAREMDQAEMENMPKGTKAITDEAEKQFINFLSNLSPEENQHLGNATYISYSSSVLFLF